MQGQVDRKEKGGQAYTWHTIEVLKEPSGARVPVRASETVTWRRTDKSEVVKRGRKEIGRGRRPSKGSVRPDQGPGAWKELCVQVAVAGAMGGTAPEGRPGTLSGRKVSGADAGLAVRVTCWRMSR